MGVIILESLDHVLSSRVRRAGGGRKRLIEVTAQIDEIFLEVLRSRTAGDPMQEEVMWTDLSPSEIAEFMQHRGLKVSPWVVEQLLKKHGYSQRCARKTKSLGEAQNRNEQFENIEHLRRPYQQDGNPIISMDAKKKNF